MNLFIAIALLFASILPLRAAAVPPASFTHIVTAGTKQVTVDFVAHHIRHANFNVKVQQADGTFLDVAPGTSRIYYGTVQEWPGAVAAGWLKDDATLFTRVFFEDGEEWTSTGGDAVVWNSVKWLPRWPTVPVPNGGAGGTVYAAEVAVDLTYAQYLASGGTVNDAVQMAEWSVMSVNCAFLRDAAILHQIGRVLIRGSKAVDPYHVPNVTARTLIDTVKDVWKTGKVPGDSKNDLGVVADPSPGARGSGFATIASIGTPGYAGLGSEANGDFYGTWRHEVGHNWGAGDWEDGGPEGTTIMAGNDSPRYSSSEISRFIVHRNSRIGFLDVLANYPFALPPRANMDSVVVEPGVATTLDVLVNDSDSNGDAISLLSFDAASYRGGLVVRSFGTGPGGRDELRYSPPVDFTNGTDFFTYRIADSTGKTATGYVISRPSVTTAVKPLYRWKLDETTGTEALDSMGQMHGTHLGGVKINQAPVSLGTGRSASYDGVNGYTSLPLPGLVGRELSFSVWVRRDGVQANNAAIFSIRNGSSGETSLFFRGKGDTMMMWNGRNTPSYVDSQNPLPDQEWCLVVMTASPSNVIMRIRTPEKQLYRLLLRAPVGDFLEQLNFNGPILLGRNQPSQGAPVYFRGGLDDFRIYRKPLDVADVEALYTQGRNPPTGEIIAPQPGAQVNPTGTVFSALGSSGSPLRAVEFIDPGTGLSYGPVSSIPLNLAVDFIAPGARQVRAVADYGDLDYQITLGPVAFTVLAEAKPAVRLAVDGYASRDGAVPADFVFRRRVGLGSLTLPFTLSGTAASGIDYAALPNSVSFAPGQTEVRLTLNPKTRPNEDALSRVATLTLNPLDPGAGFVVEGPISVSMELGTAVTSMPPPTLEVEGYPSRNPAVPAAFVFRRPSSPAWLTLSFTLTGSALNGTHYKPLPTRITFWPNHKEARLWLTPILPTEEGDTLSRVATLTLEPSAGVVVEGPSSVSMVLEAAVTAAPPPKLPTGYWGTAATWSNNRPAPLTGIQNVGADYIILSDNTVKSDDTFANESVTLDNQAFFGRSLRITNGGVLELVRNHTNQFRIVTYNLPPIRAEQGSSINFKAPAPVRHILNSNLHVVGDMTIRHPADGSYSNDIMWNGQIAGAANISLVSAASNSPFRPLQVNSESNPFSGNWTLNAEPITGLNTTGLIAEAARALGTGTVTVGRRASLINQHPQGLDSLSGITLAGDASYLDLKEPVNGPEIPLTVNNPSATVLIGPARSTLGSLSGTGGTLKGNNEVSRLTIDQQIDGSFAGNLRAPLRFEKTGSARLDLTGQIDAAVNLAVHAGALTLPTAQTIGSLELSGGTLRLPAPTGNSPALTVVKNVNSTGGRIEVVVNALPADGSILNVLRYQGVLTGALDIKVTGADLGELIAIINIGSGFNDTVTLRFTTPYAQWITSFGYSGDNARRTNDVDGDGLTNEQEFLFGFDPGNPNQRLIMSVEQTVEKGRQLVINRVIPIGEFRVEWTTDLLLGWPNSEIIQVAARADDFHLLAPQAEAARCFYRLRWSPAR
jgi:hypothetical protein